MAPQRESAGDVIRRVCAERGATLVEVAQSCALTRKAHDRDGQEFALKTPRATYKLQLPLLGRHQLDNAATAVLALEALDVEIDETALREGLAARALAVPHRAAASASRSSSRTARTTATPRAGSSQTLRDDLGVVEAVFVVGCARDKDIGALAEELAPLATQVIATRSRNPRAMDPREIARAFANGTCPSRSRSRSARRSTPRSRRRGGGAVVVCGSLFVAAEAREHVLGVVYDPPLARSVEARGERMNESNGRRRVVITGMGAMSPLGLNVDELWQGLARRALRRRADRRPSIRSNYPVKIGRRGARLRPGALHGAQGSAADGALQPVRRRGCRRGGAQRRPDA